MYTTATIPPKGLNTSFFSDPTVDKLTAESALNLDAASRNQQLCQMQKEIWQQSPWIFLWSQTLVLGYNAKITGVSYLPNEKFQTMAAHPKQ
jgi:peptide/nickel transport system substrate-binding protein